MLCLRFWAFRSRLFAASLAMAALALPVFAQTQKAETLRGGRVGWARLKTPDGYWRRHSESDGQLSRFIRERTSLNIDETWYVADVENLKELCDYPFLFANSLGAVTTPSARQNLSEYLRRGGFLVVDACINKDINPSPEEFLETNRAVFQLLVPGCEIRQLPPDHEIYRCFFEMQRTPPHTYHRAIYNARWAKLGLHGVFVQDRMVSVITLSGLQCGWSGVPATERNHNVTCMEMMLNIYIYAMTR